MFFAPDRIKLDQTVDTMYNNRNRNSSAKSESRHINCKKWVGSWRLVVKKVDGCNCGIRPHDQVGSIAKIISETKYYRPTKILESRGEALGSGETVVTLSPCKLKNIDSVFLIASQFDRQRKGFTTCVTTQS